MNPCNKCKRPMDLKCCHNCKKDAAECDVWHKCGDDCKEWEAQIQTNADRIRAMTDEELCEFLGEYKFCDICEEGCDACTYSGDCDKRLLDWLKQPAE